MTSKRLWLIALFVLTSAAATGCDLTTKSWAEGHLSVLPGKSMRVLEPWLDFSLAYNQGTAFSLMGDLGAARATLGVISFVLAVGLLLMVVFSRRTTRLEVVALATVAAGAIGNGYDRLFRIAPNGGTGVVDFIRVNYPWGGSWPTFNIADVFVFCGVVGLFACYVWQRRPIDGDAVHIGSEDADAAG